MHEEVETVNERRDKPGPSMEDVVRKLVVLLSHSGQGVHVPRLQRASEVPEPLFLLRRRVLDEAILASGWTSTEVNTGTHQDRRRSQQQGEEGGRVSVGDNRSKRLEDNIHNKVLGIYYFL